MSTEGDAKATTDHSYFAVLDDRGVGQLYYGVRGAQSRLVTYVSSYWETEMIIKHIDAGQSEAQAVALVKGAIADAE